MSSVREVIARALAELDGYDWDAVLAAGMGHSENAALVAARYRRRADAILTALGEEWAIVDRKALEDVQDTLALVEHPAFPDPVHHERVKALGREIGFGALMSTAEAGWREVLVEKDYPLGGEFVSGPCRSTVESTLKTIRAMLASAGEKKHG